MNNKNSVKGDHNNILNLVIDSLVKHKRRKRKPKKEPEPQIPQPETLEEVAQSIPPARYVPTNVITVNPAGAPTPTMFDVFKQQQLNAYENMREAMRNEFEDLKMNAEQQIRSFASRGRTAEAQAMSDALSEIESIISLHDMGTQFSPEMNVEGTQTSPPPETNDEQPTSPIHVPPPPEVNVGATQTSHVPSSPETNEQQTSPIPAPSPPQMANIATSPIDTGYHRMFINTDVVNAEEADEIKELVKEYLATKRAPPPSSSGQAQEGVQQDNGDEEEIQPAAPSSPTQEMIDQIAQRFMNMKLQSPVANKDEKPEAPRNPMARIPEQEKQFKTTSQAVKSAPRVNQVVREDRVRSRTPKEAVQGWFNRFRMNKGEPEGQEMRMMTPAPNTQIMEEAGPSRQEDVQDVSKRLNFEQIPVFTSDEKSQMNSYISRLSQHQGANTLPKQQMAELVAYTTSVIEKLQKYLSPEDLAKMTKETESKVTYLQHLKILQKYMK